MKQHKRLISSLAVASLLLISVTGSGVARAHELKESNGISSVLHIAPDDNPKANQPTRIYVSFADKKDTFNLQNCDCKLGLEQDEKSLLEVNLPPTIAGATVEASTKITFPSIGEYNLVITGAAKDGSFANFKLEYPVRVGSAVNDAATTDNSKSQGPSVLIISAGSLAVLAMIAFVSITRRARYKPAPNPVKTKKTSTKTKRKRN